MAALDGNHSHSDKKGLLEIAQAYLERFEDSEEKPDSALYSEENLKALSGVKWITRVPATLSQAKQLLADVSQS